VAARDIVPVVSDRFEQTLESASPDVLREMIRGFAQKLMDAEAEVRALARRGPDSEGVACWQGVTLGHRRLAIFDLSDAGNHRWRPDGHQHMVGPCAAFVEHIRAADVRESRGADSKKQEKMAHETSRELPNA